MPTVEDVVDFLEKNYDKDQYIAADFWTEEDVYEMALDNGIELSEIQIQEVLDIVHHGIDSEDGLPYSVIVNAIKNVS